MLASVSGAACVRRRDATRDAGSEHQGVTVRLAGLDAIRQAEGGVLCNILRYRCNLTVIVPSLGVEFEITQPSKERSEDILGHELGGP